MRTYAAFVVRARCPFDEVALALPTASAAWRSGSCLKALRRLKPLAASCMPRLPNAEQGQIYSSLSTIALMPGIVFPFGALGQIIAVVDVGEMLLVVVVTAGRLSGSPLGADKAKEVREKIHLSLARLEGYAESSVWMQARTLRPPISSPIRA